jgi:glycosyltransferase involved in cell wall biosynthesis
MNDKGEPLISVIVCTYNRCQSLAETLQSLARMTIPPDVIWEVVVIDNNSRDQTSQTVNDFVRCWPIVPLKYFLEAAPGLSHARNRGIQEGHGDILAFLDDDVLVSPNWLSEVKKAFEQYDPACVGGRVLLHESNPRPPWWDKRYDSAIGEFDRGASVIFAVQEDETMICLGANMMFRRSIFDQFGAFRTDLGRTPSQLAMGEETEMVQRLRRSNERVIYYPDALVFHCPPAQRFSKRYLREHFYNMGKWYFIRDSGRADTVMRIFGVPRWAFRSFVVKLSRALGFGLRGKRAESFFQQLQCVQIAGYAAAAWKLRKAAKKEFVSA